ncbi:MAG: multiprotein bridging factor aMBF1 [Zestosphaera sp.]
MSSDITYCEMCGKPMRKREANVVYVEGVRLVLCSSCHAKVGRRAVANEVREVTQEARRTEPSRAKSVAQPPSSRRAGVTGGKLIEEYEVVPDYHERVRRAREMLGWTQKVLAEAVKESENVIKRIESGRLVPSLELARKLEKTLKTQLLEPVADKGVEGVKSVKNVERSLTIGDVMILRKKGEKE